MRKAIRRLLSDREDIAVVGEASNIRETIKKTVELHPDLIILDVTMPEKDCIAPTKVKGLLNGAKILAITLGADEVKDELLHGIGAAKLWIRWTSPTNLSRRFWNSHQRRQRSQTSKLGKY